jgi:hypothetical protein
MEVGGQIHVSTTLSLGKQPLIPIGQETGFDSEQVWTLWRRQKKKSLAGNRNPDLHPA